MRALLRPLLFLAALIALAACAGPGTIRTTPDITHLYDPTQVWHATRGEGMQTVVLGAPFGGSEDAASTRIREILRLPGQYEPARFVARAPTAPPTGYRLALLFNPQAPAVPFQAACGDLRDLAVAPAPREAVVVHASFCLGSRALSEITAVGTASGYDDPAFAALLAHTLDELLPPYTQRSPGPRI